MESIGYFTAQFLMDRKFLGRRNLLCLTLVLGGLSLLVTMPVPEGTHFILLNCWSYSFSLQPYYLFFNINKL